MRLEHRDGRNAYYEINILETYVENIWVVTAEWGRIGAVKPFTATLKQGSYKECEKVFLEKLNKRYSHGYRKKE